MNPMPGGMNPMPGQNNNNFGPAPSPNAVPPMPNPVAMPNPMAAQQNPMAMQGAMPAQNPTVRPNIGMVDMNGAAPIQKEKRQKVHFPLFSIVGLVFACSVAGVAVVIAISNSLNYKNLEASADFSIEQAVLAAKAEQQDADEKENLEKEKWGTPNSWKVSGQWGSLSFDYPKIWSVLVVKEKEGDYLAYFRPDYVGSVSDKTERFALRLTIVSKDIESVQPTYEKVGGRKRCNEDYASFAGSSSEEWWCYSGTLEKNMVGQVVLIKLGDSQKTAILQSDATIYKSDFEKILKSLKRTISD